MFKTENPPEHPMLQGLISEFDGAIKYNAMLADHGRDKTYKGEISAAAWTREQCVEFARAWHAVAIERLRASELVGNTYRTSDGKPWNDLIPYCRNEPTAAMLAEAGK
jgi:hypothetical protein